MSAPWRIGALALLAGCGSANAGQSNPQPCAPVEAPSAEVDAGKLGGEYTVRMVATAGAKRGSTAEGRMELMPHPGGHSADSSSETTYPLYGTAELDFASVGAVVPGDPASSDSLSPGVLVIERPGRVMLRVGSEANRRDVVRFDGAFTALQVTQVTDQGFAGTWRSGLGMETSEGHFCAARAT
jgi:hypothetical protein